MKAKLLKIFAVLGCLTLAAGFAACGDKENSNPDLDFGVSYALNEAGDGYEVVGYTNEFARLMIHETYNGLPVTGIADYAFRECDALETLTIPNGVTSIGDGAFAFCWKLASVDIPDSVTSIGESAFTACSSLESVDVPEGVKSISPLTFSFCLRLTSIYLPNVTEIGKGAFQGCTSMKSMELPFVGEKENGTENIHFGYIFGANNYAENGNYVPQSLTTVSVGYNTDAAVPVGVNAIKEKAFYNCYSLTTVEVANSVTSIEKGAFEGCNGLTDITLPFVGETKDETENIHFGYVFGASSAAENGNYVPKSLRRVYVNGGSKIDNTVFANCNGLTSVTLPATMTDIAADAFDACASLSSITVNNKNTKYSSQGGILYNKQQTAIAIVPKALRGNVTLPETLMGIDSRAFENRNLTSIIIPVSVVSIGENAFVGCDGVKIYGKAESQPIGWDANWNSSNYPTYWYSENEPALNADGTAYLGNYWRYEKEIATVWVYEPKK